MSRVVPSQVVSLINSIFPTIPDRLNYAHAPYLAAILSLVEQIPPELITLDEDDYKIFVASIAALRSSINSWERRGNVKSSTKIPEHGSALAILFKCLGNCPDQGIAPSTVTLPFISDPAFEENIRMDISASNQALTNGEWKAATVLAGATVEALLLWALKQQKTNDIRTAIKALITSNKLDKNTKTNPEKWGLHQLIEVANELDVIKSETAQQARLGKNFRNLIHPGKSIRIGQICDRGTALSAVAAIEHVVRDLTL
jgi:hypothetical protein